MSAQRKINLLKPKLKLDVADYVASLAWSAKGDQLAIGQSGGGLAWLDLAAKKKSVTTQAHAQGLSQLSISPKESDDVLASGGHDGFLRLWKIGASEPFFEKKLGKEWIAALSWSWDGSFLAVACGKSVVILDAKGTEIRPTTVLASTVTSLSWYHGHKALIASCQGGLTILGIRDAAPLKTYDWKSGFWCSAWSRDGKWVAGGSQEKAVHIWEAETAEHYHMPGYPVKVQWMGFTPDSHWLVTTAGMDISMWDCSGAGPCGRNPKTILEHDAIIEVCALQQHGSLCATADEGGHFLLWDTAQKEKSALIAGFKQKAGFSAGAWSLGDTVLALGSTDGSVYLF
ncbi:MAG: hypothetical protein SH807_00980 [Blastochloris sp.]|nr:hypothetical protein [Blastochloris sp.]